MCHAYLSMLPVFGKAILPVKAGQVGGEYLYIKLL